MDNTDIYDLLAKISTQIDGLESMFREMEKIGKDRSKKDIDLGSKLIAKSHTEMFMIRLMRSNMQKLRDELDYLEDI